jgi:hypothetical protein
METIYCECGHELDEHNEERCKEYYADKWNEHLYRCPCELSRDVVQARYFASHFYKKYKTTDKIRADLLNQYWTLAGKYIQAEHDRKDLEEKLIKAIKTLDKIGKKTHDKKIAGMAYDTMGAIVFPKEETK